MEHNSRAEPRPDREKHEVLHPASHALPPLADRGEVDVVLDRHPHSKPALELGTDRHALEAVDVLGEMDLVATREHHPGDAHDGAVERLRRELTRGDQAVAKGRGDLEHASRVRARELDVLARADAAQQIADGSPQEARPEVEPQCERGVRDRLEERGAVAGTVRARLGLAHQSAVEEGLQGDRDRRLRDADRPGDLRAGDRSVTVNRVEHRSLVEVPQERRGRGGATRRRHCGSPSTSGPPRRWPLSGWNACISPLRGISDSRSPRPGARHGSTRTVSFVGPPASSAMQTA